MDVLTQALLGGNVAMAGARKGDRVVALVTGMVAGLLADADVFIRSSQDPLLTLDFHRHFTHSLVFIPTGALIAALLCWLLFRKHDFRRLYVFALLGYAFSGVLDACTSYGTHLLWPFSDERIAWYIISIVDPVFTLALIMGAVIAFWRNSPGPARAALLCCLAYLSLANWQLSRAETQAQQLAESRGHSASQMLVKPTLGNILLWRSIYRHQERYYVDAIRVGLTENRVYAGDSVAAASIEQDFAAFAPGSTHYRDILRFQHFSDGYIAFAPGSDKVLGDVRYSMSPTSVDPLWGIVLDADNPDAHVDYRFFREQDADSRHRFLQMVLGKNPA